MDLVKHKFFILFLIVGTIFIATQWIIPDSQPVISNASNHTTYSEADSDSIEDTLQTLVARINQLQTNMDGFTKTLSYDAQAHKESKVMLQEQQRLFEQQLGSFSKRLQQLETTVIPEYVEKNTPPQSLNEQQILSEDNLTLPTYDWLLPILPIEQEVSELVYEVNGQNKEAYSEVSSIADDETASVPVYTIPINTVLFDGRALTALIGKVPRGGEVQSPMPVKVIIGKDNITAGGYPIQGLAGMLFSGTAVGNWLLGCVRVVLDSATYVFADGTIRSFQAQGGSQNSQLGWLSDRQGIPCIRGKRIGSGKKGLAVDWLLATSKGFAKAYGEAETTRLSTPSGNVRSEVTGDAYDYAFAGAVDEGLESTRDLMAQRWSDSFDMVYVAPGTEVAVHITQEIAIDYPPTARQIKHQDRFTNRDQKSVLLD